ncbi:MAG: hypothetical protein VKI42_04900 [Synechococcaceae cyanobacterium]|nr:hypothetical protein [Synechococcaceae cyanobacterium]
MAATYTAVISQEGPWWVGWVEEVPGVNAQELSRDELLASLRLVLPRSLGAQLTRSATGGKPKLRGAGRHPVKRRDLLRHLQQHGCSLLREGGHHSWWHHPELLVRKICRDLAVPAP